MSTSATALLTRLRTWALVAGLTGLVIAERVRRLRAYDRTQPQSLVGRRATASVGS
jgi:hypothetical protein